MNDNFISKIRSRNVSQYKLSHETGVPYTTISRLTQGKMDINNCSVNAVYRLALYLECEIEDILNPVAYLEGIQGSYRGCTYHWQCHSGRDILVIEKGDKRITREYGIAQTNKRYYKSSKVFAEMEIDLYLRKEEAYRLCEITG